MTWCTAPGLANNTVRGRISLARTFLRWSHRTGLLGTDRSACLDHVRRQYPKIYGKHQAPHPARFLTHAEAFGTLLSACSDGTWVGSRDQLSIRLGLMGLRAAEVRSLRIADIHGSRIRFLGKGRKPRQVTFGPTFETLLDRWLRAYAAGLNRPLAPADPLICAALRRGSAPASAGRINWGQPMGLTGFGDLLRRRALTAGLGHVEPHDLRRTAAAIMHNDLTPDGGHRFDLLDIQLVLDHADPATTQRSYLQQIDTGTKDRAGALLD